MKKYLSPELDAASGYILLLAKPPQQVGCLASVLGCSKFCVHVSCSEEHAVSQISQYPPFLVILVGDHLSWSQQLLHDLRTQATAHGITIVALTDFHAPSWIRQEENPGFDGFLVTPISSDVFSSLVHSAYTRQSCFSFS